MKNLSTMYRSTQRPDPLWPEIGLYNGYQYIELCEGVWLPRTHEFLVAALMTDDIHETIKLECKRQLQTASLFKPSLNMMSNYCKLRLTLIQANTFAVLGYSYSLIQFLQKIPYTQIYTTTDLGLPNQSIYTPEQLISNSSHLLTLIHKKDLSYKKDITYWANILVYDESWLIEPTLNLLGGIYNAPELT